MEVVPRLLRKTTRFIFAGRFGSGKTEIAINFALRWAEEQQSTAPAEPRAALIDLDIVTPYFRSRDRAEQMRQRGLHVITPASVARNLDVPAVTPQVLGALQQESYPVILDVGGDEQGARVLASFSGTLRERGYTMYMVVNPYRPFTRDAEGIRESIDQIERASHLLVTGLVCNPNLLEETTPAEFAAGLRTVELASRQLGLPIAFVTLEKRLADQLAATWSSDLPWLTLDRFFVPPWAEG